MLVTTTGIGGKEIEKYFILDNSICVPDASFSMSVAEFTKIVKVVSEAGKAIGVVDYRLTDKQNNRRDFGRSLYVLAEMKTCDII